MRLPCCQATNCLSSRSICDIIVGALPIRATQDRIVCSPDVVSGRLHKAQCCNVYVGSVSEMHKDALVELWVRAG